ncbi:MAG: hypothetical protein ACFFEJ_16680 [Candidatus Thorarchaeota archaeon]
MPSIKEELLYLDRLFQIAIQLVGLQRTAGIILAALYAESCENDSGFSVSELSEVTGLSLSTVSTLCSQLDSLGITAKQSVDQENGRGRRKSIVKLRLGIDELLRIGMKRYLSEINAVMHDIKTYADDPGVQTSLTIQRAMSELLLFQSQTFPFTE